MSRLSFLRRVPWGGVLRVLACALAFLLVPMVVGTVNAGSKIARAAVPANRPAYTGQLPSPTYDPAKRVAVIVASAHGAEITDTLPTYEILARSGAFNVYVVAPERTPLPLIDSGRDGDTGLDVVPHYSFAGYDAAIGKAPDLLAVPYEGYAAATGQEPDVLAWIRAHDGHNTTLLGICVGSSILANTGLLDSHTATTNTFWFDRTAPAHPQVRWTRGVRYVDDGNVITSTNLASGVDATLHTVSRLVGRSTAEDIARQLGYTHTAYLDDPRFQAPTASALPLPIIVNEGFEWPQERLGVLLPDGVSEFALAALLDPYTSSLVAKTRVFASERAPVVSRDGLVFVPRYDVGSVPALDRVVVPAGDPTAARQQAIAAWDRLRPDRPVQDVHRGVGQGESAYEATLRDLGRSHNRMIVVPIADSLFVPTDTLRLDDAAWPVQPIAADLGFSLLGVGLVLLLGFLIGRVRSRRHAPARPYALARS